MREVPRSRFEKLEAALLECLADTRSVDGLRLAPVAVGAQDIETAASIALMSLCKDWVRPVGVKFVTGFGTSECKEF